MKQATGESIRTFLEEHIDADAALMTDERALHAGPESIFASHETANHSADEYVHCNVASYNRRVFLATDAVTGRHVSPCQRAPSLVVVLLAYLGASRA